MGGLSVFSLASTASVLLLLFVVPLRCASMSVLEGEKKKKKTCVWLPCENDVKLQSYASYENMNCGGLIYYLTSCFE